MIARFTALLLLAMTPMLAWSADLAQALTYYQQQQYATAAIAFKSLAEAGDVKAQYYLGTLYTDGLGVPQDTAKGIDWLDKAVQQKSREAAIMLGKMYVSGLGVAMDSDKGLRYFELAESFLEPEEEVDECT
jgi:TPR repeat protein